MGKTIAAELILVGSELLNGARSDAHTSFLGRTLMRAGVTLERCTIVGDDTQRIADAVRAAVSRAAVVIVSGGLGPTDDDITREGVARAAALPLERSAEAFGELTGLLEKIGVVLNEFNLRQAYIPAGAELIRNRQGTAAGFSLTIEQSRVFVLPGPPRELQPMVLESVVPYLESAYRGSPIRSAIFKTAGIGESILAELMEPLQKQFPMFSFSSLPARGCVDIIAIERRDSAPDEPIDICIAGLKRELGALLGTKLYGTGEDTLEGAVGNALAKRGETLAIAESLTGGMVGKRLTDVPGSSSFLLADVVAYSNEAKIDFLGVREPTLAAHGAVSEQVCLEMAEGVRSRTGATWGLATTGIAGPAGGTAAKPVGLCFYGFRGSGGSGIERRVFPGTRAHVRERVTNALLLLLYETLVRRDD